MTTFADLGLEPDLLRRSHDVGYEAPSPIQEQAIPPLLQGLDVIGQAQTGSGKTAAFGLPMLQYVDRRDDDVQGLVLTPTRELCIQVTQALRAYGKRKGVDVVAVFGGAPIRSQQAQLRAGGQIVVGTVGRVKDLISRHSLMLHACRFVVLDEADEMLDLGFLEDVERILALTPSSRQTALFSATMPPEIRRLADQYLYDPVTIKVKTATLTVDTVEQFALEVAAKDKTEALVDVLEAERPDQAIDLRAHQDPLRPAVPDAARPGHERQGAARRHDPGRPRRRDDLLQGRRVPLLVATDVAARGLDISGISHVINFDVPISPDVYVHRIGRTGRVGRSGRAITFYEPRQQRDIEAIEGHAGVKLSPWVKDAHVAPTPATAPPRRHSKPHVSTNGDGAESARQADRLRRPRRRDRALGHHPRDHRRRRARRRGGPQRARAGALRVRRGARADADRVVEPGRRDRGPRATAPPRARPESELGHAAPTAAARLGCQLGVSPGLRVAATDSGGRVLNGLSGPVTRRVDHEPHGRYSQLRLPSFMRRARRRR